MRQPHTSNPAVSQKVVGVAVVSGGKVLLLRRKINDFLGGYFELPGGKVEPKESLEMAIVRELKEETGLLVSHIVKQVNSFDYFVKDKLHRQHNYTVEVERINQGIELTEHDLAVWVGKDEVNLYEMTEEMRRCVLQILDTIKVAA